MKFSKEGAVEDDVELDKKRYKTLNRILKSLVGMYSRKRPAINTEVFAKRKMEATDEENLEGEDEAEGSQCDFRQTFGGFGVPCGIGTLTYSRGDIPQPTPFFQHNLLAGDNDEIEDFCHSPMKSEELERKLVARKVDIPLIFFGDPSVGAGGVDPCEVSLCIRNNHSATTYYALFKVYCTVPGRTSLLSSTTKYRVTVGEIQRRISPPECLNASLLGGILRRAKSKDGGKTLRDSLRKIGLTLPAGRRKQANVTAWTALVEEEAVHMAKDFALVCEKEFHAREIGIFLTKTSLAIDQDVLQRRSMLENSKKIVSELYELLAADRTPLTPFVAPTRPTITLEPSIQQHLSHYTLMTHGFGGVAMVAVLESIKSVIDESIKYLDRNCGGTYPAVVVVEDIFT
ncbi:unnamed protein product [Nippostrongylus brasiliensis]|uniref:TF_AP-2 domain-containing protein n=1 Tax=Nippostrongylus brasiliensis TaxID=27835 RepID=A0A158R177_NIPBR|nr:unnamed protein product [Nippostrongylus brasiliensis]